MSAFVDRVQIRVQAGRGGNGAVSFRREKYIPKGGPDGGDGGDGGSIILVAEEGVDSLSFLAHRQQWSAGNGEQGGTANCSGKSSENVTLKVPPGTLVYDAEKKFLLKDLAQPGESFVVARGGKGGKGNTRFKSSINRAPRQFGPGEEGETRLLMLELKVIADVGLIGKPNAGKSTLLSRLTRARPEIAAYPFTTKYPNLGRVAYDQDHSFVLADIPGLIEGASEGVGLGHDFLRHIERAGILVHLVEPAPTDDTDPLDNYRTIRNELVCYNPELGNRPEIIAVSKCELPGSEEFAKLLEQATSREVIRISAVTGQGLDKLLQKIIHILEENRANKAAKPLLARIPPHKMPPPSPNEEAVESVSESVSSAAGAPPGAIQ